MNKIKSYLIPILIVWQIFFCTLYILNKETDTQTITKGFLYILSIMSSVGMISSYCYLKNQYKINIVYIFFTTIIISFSLVGNELFVYPLNIGFSIYSVMRFLAVVCWILPISICLISLLCKQGILDVNLNERKYKQTIIICIVAIFLACLFWLQAYRPGICNQDTMYCSWYAHRLGEVDLPLFHPPFYILCMRVLFTVNDSMEFILLIQIIFFISIIYFVFQLFRQLKINVCVIITLTILLIFHVPTMLNLVSVSRDTPYTISILGMCFIFIAIALRPKIYLKNRIIHIGIIVFSVLIAYVRLNGIAVSALCLTVLLIWKKKKILITFGFTVILLIFIPTKLYSALRVTTNEYPGFKYTGLIQDVLGVYYNSENFDQDMEAIIEPITSLEEEYDPYCTTSLGVAYLEAPVSDFIKGYIKTFVKNPVIMVRAILCRVDCGWDIFLGVNGRLDNVGFTGYFDKEYTAVWGEEDFYSRYGIFFLDRWGGYMPSKSV